MRREIARPFDEISIHAPRTGSDRQSAFDFHFIHHFNPRSPHGERLCRRDPPKYLQDISIHAPRTGSDGNRDGFRPCAYGFQSTLPARGATVLAGGARDSSGDFNPRSPHGERRAEILRRKSPMRFQSTLPARGATTSRPATKTSTSNFNPRSPHGERPGAYFTTAELIDISIHAPRTGSDVCG